MAYRLRRLPHGWTKRDVAQIANAMVRALRRKKPWLSESTVRDAAHGVYDRLDAALREGRTDVFVEVSARYPRSRS